MKRSPQPSPAALARIAVNLVLGCAVLAGPALGDGVVLHFKTTDHSGPEPQVETSRMDVRPPLLKMEIQSKQSTGLPHTMIFRGGADPQIAVVDHEKKSYLVLDPETIATLGRQLQMAMQQLVQQLDRLTPEQRALVGEALDRPAAAPAPEPSEVVETGERAVRQGFPVARYDVLRREEKIREVWVTPWSEVEGGREAFGVVREMSDFYGGLMDSLQKIAPGSALGGSFALDNHPFAELERMGGMPVVTRNFEGGNLTTEVALESIAGQDFELADFEPPADYQVTSVGAR